MKIASYKNFVPIITNLYNISFNAEFIYNYTIGTNENTYSINPNVMNPRPCIGDFDKDLKNLMNPLVDKGIINT